MKPPLLLIALLAPLVALPAAAPAAAASAAVQRAVPPGLPPLPLKLVAMHGDRAETRPASAADAALTTLAANAKGATDCTVNPNSGTDTTNGGNKNFATIGYFVRTDTRCTVATATTSFVETQISGPRFGDPSQANGLALKVFKSGGFDVRIRVPGPDPTTT